MKKSTPRKKLGDILESIHQKGDGLLTIRCNLYEVVCDPEPDYLRIGRKNSKNIVVRGMLESIRVISKEAQQDALNIKKCAAYVQKKYPHAIFSREDSSLIVDQLTPREIEDCLSRKELRFTYDLPLES